jgi:hypothetical protein
MASLVLVILLFREIFARRKFQKFNKLWTKCTQAESRLISKSNNINDEENQYLDAYVKKMK